MDTLWDRAVPALLGLLAGAIGSLIAPWVKWRIELKREVRRQKIDTIARWRAMLAEAIRQSEHEGEPIQKFIEGSADFYSLKDYLSQRTLEGLFSRTFVVPPDRSTVDGIVSLISSEISEVEKKWKVRPE